MKEEIKEVVKGFFKWAEGYIENNITFITKLPKFLRIFVGKTGVSIAKFLLDLNYFATEKYTPKRWNEEMRGLEKATGISIWTFR